MKHLPLNKTTLFATLFLIIIAGAVGVTASYTEPGAIYPYPTNTQEPVDISTVPQVKTGGLSVAEFLARGNANLKQDVFVDGLVQGGQPGDTPTFVAIGTDTTVTGELHAAKFINSGTLTHTESSPKPVCADAHGNVVFCSGGAGPGPGPTVDLCTNIPGNQNVLPADITIEDPSQPTFCTQTIRGTITLGEIYTPSSNFNGSAFNGTMGVTNITINSVGGITTSAWPDPVPLRFRFGYCSSWNNNYSGPKPPINGVYSGSIQNGICSELEQNAPFKALLPYGYTQYADGWKTNFPYIAYDSVTQVKNNFNGVSFAKGIFDGYTYESSGSKIGDPGMVYGLNLWYTKGKTTANFSNIMRPPELIFLYDVKLPVGYKLVLTTPPAPTKTEVKIF